MWSSNTKINEDEQIAIKFRLLVIISLERVYVCVRRVYEELY